MKSFAKTFLISLSVVALCLAIAASVKEAVFDSVTGFSVASSHDPISSWDHRDLTPPGTGGIAEKKVAVHENYGRVPLYFIENRGQADDRVKYYEAGNGHTTFFTREGVVFGLRTRAGECGDVETPEQSAVSHGVRDRFRPTSAEKPVKSSPLEMTFLGMRKDVEIISEGLQEYRVNYFIGNEPEKWRTNIPTYRTVLYREAYEGIDLKFYGNNRQMEYDIVVNPGGDPSRVAFQYNGAEKLEVAENGDLLIHLKEETKLVQRKPVVYQEIEGKRIAREGSFNIWRIRQSSNDSEGGIEADPTAKCVAGLEVQSRDYICRLELGAYDERYPLVIDPVLVYSTYLGGSASDSSPEWLINEEAAGIAVDASGNAYVTGVTTSSDFPTMNALQPSNRGNYDAFVTKINPSGTALVYSTYLGGDTHYYVHYGSSGSTHGNGIAVDASGNAYVTGGTTSNDFPTRNALYPNFMSWSPQLEDAFVTKINPSGTALVYSTYLGGQGNDYGNGIAVDASGNAYVTGLTISFDFPRMNLLFPTKLGGTVDAFVTKIDPSGTALVYSTYLGGSSGDDGRGIAVDASGNAYVTGYTASSDFPTTINALDPTLRGSSDAFVTKINPSGTALVYSTYLGGSGSDDGNGIAVDASGNAYVTGLTASSNFPTENPLYPHISGGRDVFVARIAFEPSVVNMVVSGTTLYASYVPGGLWTWNGNAWSRIHPSSPQKMAASASVLYADFGPLWGICEWNGEGWTQLHPSSPQKMAASASVLYADFGSPWGIWQWNGTDWTQLHPGSPQKMAASASVLYADFGSPWGIWQWNGTDWTQLHPGSPQKMAASPSVLYADFGPPWGIWQWSGTGWSQIHANSPTNMAVSALSGLYADFGPFWGICEWNGTGWSQLF